VATSDHGESRGEHGEDTHAYTIYDATQHVPLLMRGPGLPAGTKIEPQVRLADVAPSLVELLGASPLPGAKGSSLRSLVAGEPDAPRTAYLETLATRFDWRWSPLFGIRSATHKYVRAPQPELYDLRADPGETRNLASAEPDLAAALDRALDERLADRGPARPNLALDPTERARLQALGYVAPTAEAGGALGSEALGVAGGADPKNELHLVRELHHVDELLGDQRFAEALALVEGLGERGFEIEVMRIRAALGAGRLDIARACAGRLLKDAPENGISYAVLGRVQELEGDALGAAAAYERALALEAPSSAHLTGLGRLAEAAGRREESRDYYERARLAAIPDPEATWRLAALAFEAGDAERGSALLREVPQGHLRREDAALRVGRAELGAGRSELAQIRVDAALLDQPDSLALLQLRADILDARGELAQARTAREKLLARAPGNPAVQNDLAWTLARLGQNLPRALALARAAVAGSERLPETLDTVAAVLAAQRRWQEAGSAVDEGLRRAEGETRTRLLFRKAEVQAALGQRDAARASLVEARAAAGASLALAGDEKRVRAMLGDVPP
jgi:Tfp pilus assembly protein PilF